jgi:hypothetical protein
MRAMICSVLALAPVLGLALPVLGQGATAAPESGDRFPGTQHVFNYERVGI